MTPAKPPRRRFRPLLLASAAAVGVVLAGGVGLYLFRTALGVRLAQSYLSDRGVPAAIAIERLDAKGLAGRLRLGPADAPDLVVERIEVEFETVPMLRRGFALPRIRSVRMVRPHLKARFDGRRLSFGSLQRLVDEALSKPGGGPGPDIRIEAAEVRLDSYAGPAVITGDALLDDGRLTSANLRMPAARLALRPGLTASIASAGLVANGTASRLTAHLDLKLDGLEGQTVLDASDLTVDLALPYGAKGFASIDGPVTAHAALTAAAAGAGTTRLRGAKLTAGFDGIVRGPLTAIVIEGAGDADLQARAAEGGAAGAVQRLDARAQLQGLHWRGQGGRLAVDRIALRSSAGGGTFAGVALAQPAAAVSLVGAQASFGAAPWRVSAHADGLVSAERAALTAPAAALPKLSVKAAGDLAFVGDGSGRWTLAGSARTGRGGLSAKSATAIAEGFALVGDPAKIAAALRSFDLNAPAWSAQGGNGSLRVTLGQPLRIAGAGGIEAKLWGAAGKPLLAIDSAGRGDGAFTAALAGPGAPKLDLSVGGYSIAGGAVDADTRLTLAFSTPLLHGTTLAGGGRTRLSGSLAFTPAGCLAVAARSIGEMKPLMEDAKARLCGGGRPLLTADGRGWRVQGRIEAAAAALPASEAILDEGAGELTLAGRAGTITGRLQVARARIVDLAAEKRFHPLLASGALSTAGADWTGTIAVAEAARGRPVARVTVRQSPRGEGVIDIEAPLTFAPGGLQPHDLSPIGEDLVSEVQGSGLFTGRIAWNGEVLTSSGRFTAQDAAFRSILGKASGAAARITFSSLIPLIAAPGQSFTAAKLDGITPLTDVSTSFSMNEIGMELANAKAAFSGGRLSIAALSVPFVEDATLTGRLKLEQVDLGGLVKASSLADQVTLDAKIDGEIPFSIGPAGIRVEDGVMVSVGAGRLSIMRAALAGAVATGGAEGAQPNAVQDFAYQALENLAFDKFDAKIASRPEGRLGAVFHIVGRNDPPGKVEALVGLFDLLRGKAFDKPISLPKGTPVDLTLDTSLNFDELLKAYGELGRSGSDSVQTGGATRPKDARPRDARPREVRP